MKNNGRPWHALAHALWVVALLLSVGCGDGGTDDTDSGVDGSIDRGADDRTLWNDDSVAIDFTLRGPVSQVLCKRSATRDELSDAQLEGLASLELHDAQVQAGCDIYNYAITVHAQDGSSKMFQATDPDCASQPIVLFADFEAWAQSTPCSRSQSN